LPAVSKSQQQLFGQVYAYKKGKLKNPSQQIIDMAKHISEEDARDFAKTKHTGLPEKVSMFGGPGDQRTLPRTDMTQAPKTLPGAVGPVPTGMTSVPMAGGAATSMSVNKRDKPSVPSRGTTNTKMSSARLLGHLLAKESSTLGALGHGALGAGKGALIGGGIGAGVGGLAGGAAALPARAFGGPAAAPVASMLPLLGLLYGGGIGGGLGAGFGGLHGVNKYSLREHDKEKPKKDESEKTAGCGSMSKYKRGKAKNPSRGTTMTKISAEEAELIRTVVAIGMLKRAGIGTFAKGLLTKGKSLGSLAKKWGGKGLRAGYHGSGAKAIRYGGGSNAGRFYNLGAGAGSLARSGVDTTKNLAERAYTNPTVGKVQKALMTPTGKGVMAGGVTGGVMGRLMGGGGKAPEPVPAPAPAAMDFSPEDIASYLMQLRSGSPSVTA
jgi:hypothetical protein